MGVQHGADHHRGAPGGRGSHLPGQMGPRETEATSA